MFFFYNVDYNNNDTGYEYTVTALQGGSWHYVKYNIRN